MTIESTPVPFNETPQQHIDDLNSTTIDANDSYTPNPLSETKTKTALLLENPKLLDSAKRANMTPEAYLTQLKENLPPGADIESAINDLNDLEVINDNSELLGGLKPEDLKKPSFWEDAEEYLNQTNKLANTYNAKGAAWKQKAITFAVAGLGFLAIVKEIQDDESPDILKTILDAYELDAIWKAATIDSALVVAAKAGSYRTVLKLLSSAGHSVSLSLRYQLVRMLIQNYKRLPSELKVLTDVGEEFGRVLELIYPEWQVGVRNERDTQLTVFLHENWLEASEDSLEALSYSPLCQKGAIIQTSIRLKREFLKDVMELQNKKHLEVLKNG